MHRPIACLPWILVLVLSLHTPIQAQGTHTTHRNGGNGLNVFVDCIQMHCDMNHFRREIPFVNYVRDRRDADVHILATSQGTGAGREYIFNFIGLNAFTGHSDTLRYVSSSTDVRDEERDGQTRTLQMGLMRFVANTPAADFITISYNAPSEEAVRAFPEDDPWNYWVFRIGGNGSLNSESLEKHFRTGGSISASRTTENWRINLFARGNYSEDRYEYEEIEDSVAVYNNSTASASTYLIRSLGDHWGAGIQASIGNSIEYNQDLYVRIASGLEYSVFPYSESTRRSFTLLYTLGLAAFDYEEMTIFDRTSESLLQHGLEAALGYVQPWGNIGADLEATSYLHDFGLHRVEAGIRFNVRVVRGLQFNWWSRIARIRDQIYLSSEGIPQDEILLQRRARGTEFESGMGFGFSYTFGSIFNNVVNPRMDDFR